PAAAALGVAAALFAAGLVAVQLRYARPGPSGPGLAPLLPMLQWSGVLAAAGVAAGVLWWLAGWAWRALRGRGGLVALTLVIVAGAPGLAMDMAKSVRAPNGGAYDNIVLPRSRVLAARWVRDRSRP